MLHQLKPLVSCLNLSELVSSGLSCLELLALKIFQLRQRRRQRQRFRPYQHLPAHRLWCGGSWRCWHGVGDGVGDGSSDGDDDVIDAFELVPTRLEWIRRTIPVKE